MTALTEPPDDLVHIVDRALADAVERAGPWLACRPGCSACCHGVFAISALDAHRLQLGLQDLQASEPQRAHRVQARAAESVTRLRRGFPGDPQTGELFETPEAIEAFDDFAEDEPCPALDPVTQTCDLYRARPILCRTFGPPLQVGTDGLAVCDLCFGGASPAEVKRCQIDPAILEAQEHADMHFLEGLGQSNVSRKPETIIAFALNRREMQHEP